MSEKRMMGKQQKLPEKLFNELFNGVTDGVIYLDVNGKFLALNASYARMHGYTIEEMSTMHLRDMDASEFDASHPDRIKRILAGESLLFEVNHKCKNGAIISLEVSATLIRAEGKTYILAIHRDITRRKKAEESLRKSEAQLRATLEATGDGILAVDTMGKVIHASRKFVELWRIPEVLVESRDDRVMLEFVLNQLTDPDAFLDKVRLLYGSDEGSIDTLDFKDGRVFERYSFPMKMDGIHIGRVWSFRDITALSLEKAKTLKSLRELKTIHDNVPFGIVYLDKDYLVISANKFLTDLAGCREEDLIGKKCYETIGEYAAHPAHKGFKKICSFCKLSECFETGAPVEIERSFAGKIIKVTSIPEFDAHGNIYRLLGIIEDITDRKKAMERMESKNIALREVLEQLEVEKRMIQHNISANMEKLVLPTLEKLKVAGVLPHYVNLLQQNVTEIASSFGAKISDAGKTLSPKEVEICNMIKEGYENKEIAKCLNSSVQTIEKHRKNIRKKLGIAHHKVNLNTYLQQL